MYFYKKKEKVSALYSLILVGLFASFLNGGNVIINKSVVVGSSGSGNTGIIINGKKVDSPSLKPIKKEDLKEVKKKIPCDIKNIMIALSNFSFTLKREKECYAILPKYLEKKAVFTKEMIKISDNHDVLFPIEISLNSFDKISLFGDYNFKLQGDFERLNIESNGDGKIEISSKIDEAFFDLVGDFSIKFYKDVKRLDIEYTGDVELDLQKVDALSVEGTGDIEIEAVRRPLKIKKDVVGDFVISY